MELLCVVGVSICAATRVDISLRAGAGAGEREEAFGVLVSTAFIRHTNEWIDLVEDVTLVDEVRLTTYCKCQGGITTRR